MRPRPLLAMILGAAACAGGAGLVLAQDVLPPPPPPPGYVPGGGQPAQGAPAGQAEGTPTVQLGGPAPPPEEGAPPPEIANETAEAEPLPQTPDKKADPMKRPRFAAAILQAVDKTTAETLRFEAKVGEPVRYKGLVLTVHACEGSAPDEGVDDSFAHLDIQAQADTISQRVARVVFRGWMFSSSPGLHPVEHPLYDVWLIACKTAAPPAPGVNL